MCLFPLVVEATELYRHCGQIYTVEGGHGVQRKRAFTQKSQRLKYDHLNEP